MFDRRTLSHSPIEPIVGREFVGEHIRTQRPFEHLAISNCRFEGCSIALNDSPGARTIIRNVQFQANRVRGCSVGPAVLEDVVIDGLSTADLFQVWGAALRHVTLRGRIGRLMVSNIHSASAREADISRFQDANREYYANTDWALDIADADFVEADLRGVPGRLVRRDPETQFLVLRENLLDGRWRSINLAGTWWATSLQGMLDDRIEAEVHVAPRRSRDFKILLEGLRRLRSAGIAEAD
jgi:hypothetical protein